MPGLRGQRVPMTALERCLYWGGLTIGIGLSGTLVVVQLVSHQPMLWSPLPLWVGMAISNGGATMYSFRTSPWAVRGNVLLIAMALTVVMVQLLILGLGLAGYRWLTVVAVLGLCVVVGGYIRTRPRLPVGDRAAYDPVRYPWPVGRGFTFGAGPRS